MVIVSSINLDYFIERFNPNLLSTPAPKFGDDCETLAQVYNRIVDKFHGEDLKNENRVKKLSALKKQFLEIYERAKAKETELEGKTEHVIQGFMYFFATSGRGCDPLFRRLRERSYSYPKHVDRKHDQIQKV